ncbi:RNase H family protein [Nocardioides sp. P5_E3]
MSTDHTTDISVDYGCQHAAKTACETEAPKPPKATVAAGIAAWQAGSSTGWGVTTNDAQEFSGLVKGGDAQALLKAFEQVVALADVPGVIRVELFCSDRTFLEAVAPHAAAWPQLTIHPWSEGWERGWLVASSRKLARNLAEPPVPAPAYVAAVPLLAATDGSKGAKGRSGFGWVTAEGDFGFGSFAGPILLTELAAVEALLTDAPQRRPLTVLVDSRDALRVLTGLQRGEAVTAQRVPGTHTSWALLRRLQAALCNRVVTFCWVRGHAGNPLNECADRIALQARRHLDGGTAPEVLDKVMARILTDFRTTDCYHPAATAPPYAHSA